MMLLPFVRSKLWGSLFLSLFMAGCATTQSAEPISTSVPPAASAEAAPGASTRFPEIAAAPKSASTEAGKCSGKD